MSGNHREQSQENSSKSVAALVGKESSCTTCDHQRHTNAALTLQRARISHRSLAKGDILQLQRTMGNQAVAQMFREVVQRQEEDELQAKFEPVQRQEDEELQAKFATTPPAQLKEGPGQPINKTGMPNQLKTGLENLSGIDMSGVQVHFNSPKPAQLSALAYTQGTDIHVAPGQEKHLPHEGWHAVQQMQGRVQPNLQVKGTKINDDYGLEKEADVMGGIAVQVKDVTCQKCKPDNHSFAKAPGKDKGETQQKSTADLTPFSFQKNKMENWGRNVSPVAQLITYAIRGKNEKQSSFDDIKDDAKKISNSDKKNSPLVLTPDKFKEAKLEQKKRVNIVAHGNVEKVGGYTHDTLLTHLTDKCKLKIKKCYKIILHSCDSGVEDNRQNKPTSNTIYVNRLVTEIFDQHGMYTTTVVGMKGHTFLDTDNKARVLKNNDLEEQYKKYRDRAETKHGQRKMDDKYLLSVEDSQHEMKYYDLPSKNDDASDEEG